MGNLMAFAGDWERGCAAAEQGMRLNPNHPGWYRFGAFFNAYRKRDYRAALDVALRINVPGCPVTHAALAATYGQLGESDGSERALRDLLALKPDFARHAREELRALVRAWRPRRAPHRRPPQGGARCPRDRRS